MQKNVVRVRFLLQAYPLEWGVNVSMNFIAFYSECSDDEKCLYYTFSKLRGPQQTWRLCRNEEKFRKTMETITKKLK